jgi:signal recognition particle subunit SEC65
MGLEHRTKKELADMVRELEVKLKEVKHVESQILPQFAELEHPALGLTKDSDGYYHMVHIKYDLDKKTAMIDTTEKIETRDQAIVLYRLKQQLTEKIMRKARGGMYDK